MNSSLGLGILITILCLPSLAEGQSGCPNLDFEQGDFSGWNGTTGCCCGSFTHCGGNSCRVTASFAGIVTGRHTITSGSGTDPNTNNHVPVVFPDGGLHSARLGNANVMGEGECLSYTISVNANNALFVYRYAVVLEDPGHPACNQPRFEVTITDQSDNIIPCGFYSVSASAGIPGWEKGDADIIYKPWTSVGVDLSNYTGQTLTLRFCTGDCDWRGHFGYAYMDGYCSPLQIVTQYCKGDTVALLSAPEGFSYLWNTGDTTRNISITSPANGASYTCTITSVTGCQVTLNTILQTNVINVASQVNHVKCFRENSGSIDLTVTGGTTPYQFLWSNGANTEDITNLSSGAFKIEIVDAAFCKESVVVFVSEPSELLLNTPSKDDCGKGDGSATAIVKGGTLPYTYQWSSSPIQTTADAINLVAGNYLVMVADANGCWRSGSVTVHNGALPSIHVFPEDTIIKQGQSVLLTIDEHDLGGSIRWSPYLGLDNPNSPNPLAAPTKEGKHIYYAILTAENGCSVTDSAMIEVELCSSEDIYVPNAFIPEISGSNELLFAYSEKLTMLNNFRIFDRWGKVVFQTEDMLTGWNGMDKSSGNPVESGVFVYAVEMTCPNGISKAFKKGNVTVIR